jgi:DNA uptake protein ComE-like DNA-binding protein
MNRFFEFSTRQLRVVIFLTITLVVLSVYHFLRDYSEVEESDLKFSIHVGDDDRSYAPVFTVDLNLSPADSLELLPGIGPVLAARIVAYRDSTRFERPDDILKVEGIGYKTYEKLRSFLRVRAW